MTSIYTILENNVILDSLNNSLGMRYDPISNPLNFILNPFIDNAYNSFTLIRTTLYVTHGAYVSLYNIQE